MTREEAISVIKSECYVFNPLDLDKSTRINTALDVAIQALEQEPCEDCISREAVLDKAWDVPYDGKYVQVVDVGDIKELPSVTPALKLDQESIFDNIRADVIARYPKNYAGEPEFGGNACEFSLNEILKIFDKYKAEMES